MKTSFPASRPLWPWAVAVVAAALLAHRGCLGSVFYLDDWTQIVQCDFVDQGTWYAIHQRALTYLTYFLTYRAFGLSPVAFHAGNLVLHTVVSLVLLGFAREFLAVAACQPPACARRVAGWAALLFAVHPLCSEMPNYARARDIGMVSLFALLAAWAAVRWRRDGAWRWLGATCGAVAAATFCKEVGLPLAAGTAVLAALGTGRPRSKAASPFPPGAGERRRSRNAWVVVGAVLLLLGVGSTGGLVSRLSGVARRSLDDPRLGWHVLTEARVFWMYLARVAWPAHLCSDHQLPWTVSTGDLVAWIAAGGEMAVAIAATVALCQRRRPAARAAGALAAVALLDIVHRLANVSGELMVEYRMYPAMLPICLLLAWGLDGLRQLAETRYNPPPVVARSILAGIVAACLLASARRTLDWRSLDALVANVVAQYPANGRARQELQEADLRAGRWESALARQPGIRQACDDALAFNTAHSLRKYEPAYLTMARILSEGNTALALARTGKRSRAFAHLTWIHTVMDESHFAHPFFWGAYYYASAMVHDTVGERQDAIDDLRLSAEFYGGEASYSARQLRRYQQGKPLL